MALETHDAPKVKDIYCGGIGLLLEDMHQSCAISDEQLQFLVGQEKLLAPVLNNDMLDMLVIITNGNEVEKKNLMKDLMVICYEDHEKIYELAKSVRQYSDVFHDIASIYKEKKEQAEMFIDDSKYLEEMQDAIANFVYQFRVYFDHQRTGRGLYKNLYNTFGIEYDSAGMDRKLDKNSMLENVVKGGIDELMNGCDYLIYSKWMKRGFGQLLPLLRKIGKN